jgi:hypothetical protein
MANTEITPIQKIRGKLRYLDRSQLLYLCKKLKLRGLSQKKKAEIQKKLYTKLDELENTIDKTQTPQVSFIPVLHSSKVSKHSKKREHHSEHSKVIAPQNNVLQDYFPKVARLIVIGDLHGDLRATIQCLKLANVISQSIPYDFQDITKIQWTGNNTFVVQLGDQIDRVRPAQTIDDLCSPQDPELVEDEGSDLKIMCLMDKLNEEAKKQGGRCISILGNHELMNVDGDFRYVSPREFREFGNYFKASRSQKNKSLPYGYFERRNAFSPGGVLARRMAQTRYSIVQVGSWVFVHGGIHPILASSFSIHDINKNIKRWLEGESLEKNQELKKNIDFIYHNEDDSVSPFWSRIYSDLEEYNAQAEQTFKQTIDILNRKNNRNSESQIKGMIMGHSPQFMYNKGINSACNGRCWRVDVGMSRAFGVHNPHDPTTTHRSVQILEIKNDNECNIIRKPL